MADTDLVTIKVNGIEVQAPKNERAIEAAKRAGVDIPVFCYHPRLSMEEGGANCRMCLVEVAMPRKNPDGSVTMAKMPKPQTACSLPIADGMEIITESEAVARDRKGILEFLLINHPLDCPICDRGGECPLQNNTLHYGADNTRYIEEKRHFPKAYPLSEYVVFDRERCIHCARCTRFTTDISGDAQLDFLFRGASMEVGTFNHTTFKSKFSGNVIELCPVGALLSRTYRFKARPWDLLTQRSICTQCSNGCNVKLDYRVSKLQRVLARVNESVNEEWTCDRGKFGMGYVSADDRIKQPLIRRGGTFAPVSWDDAYALIISKLREAGPAIGGIGGYRATNEDVYVWQRFFRETLGVNNLDHRMGPHFGPTNGPVFSRFGHHTMGNAIADLEQMKTILVFGSNLVDEQPIVFLRVRKAWRFKGASVVEIVPRILPEDDFPNHVSEFASVSLRYSPGTEIALLGGLMSVMLDENLLDQERLGRLNVAHARTLAGTWSADRAATECGVTKDALTRAARLLAGGDMAILAGKYVTDHAHSEDVLNALGNLAALTGNGANLNVPVTRNNEQGAMDLGILPDSLPGYTPAETPGLNTEQMLDAAASGELKLLWIVGADPVADFYDPMIARRGLENCPFTVVHAWSMNETAQMADVVLPVQTVAERDGTFTNVERRVQRFWKAFEVSPDILPDWLVFQQIGALMGKFMPYFSARDIVREVAAKVPMYAGCTLKELGDEGVRWSYPDAERPQPDLVAVEYKAPVAVSV